VYRINTCVIGKLGRPMYVNGECCCVSVSGPTTAADDGGDDDAAVTVRLYSWPTLLCITQWFINTRARALCIAFTCIRVLLMALYQARTSQRKPSNASVMVHFMREVYVTS